MNGLGRIARGTAAAAAALALAPAAAQAESYFVRASGDDAGDCATVATACLTVQRAIEQHRLDPQPDDLIDVGAGLFIGNVEAGDAADDGLTIRGTLGPDGARLTTLEADGTGTDMGSAVAMGDCSGTAVTLRDVAVDTNGADPLLSAIVMDGASALRNVAASVPADSEATEVVLACGDATIEDSEITGTGQVEGVVYGGTLTMTDSTVTTEDAAVVGQLMGFGGETRIERSHLGSAPDAVDPVLLVAGDLVLDSSLLTGGPAGIVFGDGLSWRILQSTIDAGEPGYANPGVLGVVAVPFADDPATLRVDSSVLVEEIFAFDGEGSAVCSHSDLPGGVAATPAWSVDCEPGTNENASTPPDELFVGGTPFSWALLSDAPAVDAGNPVPLLGMGDFDITGAPRVQPGTAATCPDGIRDMGAYERAAVSCDPPDVEADVAAVDFGDQRVGTSSAPRTVTLTNTGGAPLTVRGYSLPGDPRQLYLQADTCRAAPIAPGDTCTFELLFRAKVAGPVASTLRVNSDAASHPLLLPVSGTAVAPGIAGTPDPVAFGDQRVGTTSAARTLTFENTGTAPLTIRGFSLPGNPRVFSLTGQDCTGAPIAPAATCTAQLTFRPRATGAAGATLRVNHDAPGSPLQVPVSGTGVLPGIAATPSPVAFGDQPVGTWSAPITLTIENTGSGPLEIRGLDLRGPAHTYAKADNGCKGATLAPSETCTVDLRFRPRVAGALPATLRVASDAPSGPLDVPLSGAGT